MEEQVSPHFCIRLRINQNGNDYQQNNSDMRFHKNFLHLSDATARSKTRI